ncbi:heparinase II/III family protein [Janthinobacterium fluminis]|uniref:Alginate lyase family protein n=1 Tax=Janthinobacterium fluminis TaxID=2987524 RepID=A0ABT5K1H6_9BURK|nr:alginate lyase family protein [Janthinobacterium fluminis]MDC8757617.1 alginate lyase family protein [Janthinobacterium fluminis]
MSGRAGRLTWLLNRLRCMSAAEVVYRLRQAALNAAEGRGWLGWTAPGAAGPAPSLAGAGAPSLTEAEAAACVADAAAIRAGRVTLFAERAFEVGAEPQWNRDPLSGILGPAGFSGAIAITDRQLVGDIKHVWELNRHLHLVRLAQAHCIEAGAGHDQALAAQLRGWLEQCPPLRGPNWTSSLEIGIRLINWSLIWQLMGGEASPMFAGAAGQRLRADWLASIYAHCLYLQRHLSRHSSANNHLLGELAGLYVGACAWPCWPQSARWRAAAKGELEQQAIAQYSGDGVNREQAFSYHVFSAEFLVVAGLYGQACGDPLSAPYWQSLRRSLHFLAAVRDVGGHVPMVGDADDGMVFRLEPGAGGARAELLLALGAALAGGAAACLSARWLLAALPGPLPAAFAPAAGAPGDWNFAEGGYLLFGSRFGEAGEIKGMFDCGPLGYLGIAAHGHADALALTLSVCGEECLVDPGTYSYWQDQQWRDYFRGTSAHNTVRVDGQDQSVSGGRFMWLRKAAVTLERMPASAQSFDCRASHDGYLRLADPLRHSRSVRFEADGAKLHVSDCFAAAGGHSIEQFWHLAPGLDVRVDGLTATVRGRAFQMRVEFAGAGLDLALLRGVEAPPLGWFSRSYEAKEASPVLRVSTQQCGVPVEARFTIDVF